MKKILSLVVLAAAVAMVSCAGNPQKPAEAAEAPACEQCCPEACATCDKAATCEQAAPAAEAAPAEVAPEAAPAQ